MPCSAAATAGGPAHASLLSPSTPLHCIAGHNYIGTEHILLGLLRENEGVASRVLETLGADLQKIRTQVTALPAVLLLYMHVCHGALPAMPARSLYAGLLCAHGSLVPFGSCLWVPGRLRGLGQATEPLPGQHFLEIAWCLLRCSSSLCCASSLPSLCACRVVPASCLQVVRMVGESQETLVGAGAGTGPGSNKTPTLEEYGTNLTTQANEVAPWELAAGLI